MYWNPTYFHIQGLWNACFSCHLCRSWHVNVFDLAPLKNRIHHQLSSLPWLEKRYPQPTMSCWLVSHTLTVSHGTFAQTYQCGCPAPNNQGGLRVPTAHCPHISWPKQQLHSHPLVSPHVSVAVAWKADENSHAKMQKLVRGKGLLWQTLRDTNITMTDNKVLHLCIMQINPTKTQFQQVVPSHSHAFKNVPFEFRAAPISSHYSHTKNNLLSSILKLHQPKSIW